jgi:hypothetical protein
LTPRPQADPPGPTTPPHTQLTLFPHPGSSRTDARDGSVRRAHGGVDGAPAESRRELRPERPARQARLSAAVDLAAQERALAAALKLYLPPGKGLELAITNNHYSMISVRRRPDGYRLRIHRMFAGCEARVVRALARYVVHNDRRASALLGEYIEAHQHIIKAQPRRPRQVTLRTAGHHHDLRGIFDHLNRLMFDGKLDARITWGAVSGKRKRRRSIKMGSFSVEDRLIRIHPLLDSSDVPDYFVAWIVFHEMLHGKHDVVRQGHRRIFHSAAFLADERAFPEFERATAWERANLDRLLGA